jgi:hypothetical protein
VTDTVLQPCELVLQLLLAETQIVLAPIPKEIVTVVVPCPAVTVAVPVAVQV